MTGSAHLRETWRRLAFCVFLFDPSLATATGAKAEIVVTRLQVGRDASGGEWRTLDKFTYLLAANHAVEMTSTSPGHPTGQHGGALGDRFETTNVFGLKSTQAIRVVAGSIVVTTDSPSFTTTTTIHSDGKSTCSASADISLKPGHQLFEFGGGHFSTEVHYEVVNCAIKSIAE